jgi:hypothetical protein
MQLEACRQQLPLIPQHQGFAFRPLINERRPLNLHGLATTAVRQGVNSGIERFPP